MCKFLILPSLNTPVTSEFSRSMSQTFDCDAEFSRVSVVCTLGEAPPFMCTSFGMPTGPTGFREESTSEPNVQSVLQRKQLNCKVTGVFKKARTSKAQSKPRMYLEFVQKVYSVHGWNYFQKLTTSKFYPFESFEMSFLLAFVLVPRPCYMLTVMFDDHAVRTKIFGSMRRNCIL